MRGFFDTRNRRHACPPKRDIALCERQRATLLRDRAAPSQRDQHDDVVARKPAQMVVVVPHFLAAHVRRREHAAARQAACAQLVLRDMSVEQQFARHHDVIERTLQLVDTARRHRVERRRIRQTKRGTVGHGEILPASTPLDSDDVAANHSRMCSRPTPRSEQHVRLPLDHASCEQRKARLDDARQQQKIVRLFCARRVDGFQFAN